MNKATLLKKLDAAAKLIDEMRQEVVGKPMIDELIARTAEQIAEFVNSAICLKCGKPIGEQKPSRGVHERCYQKLRRDGELERAEANGRILPVGKPGPRSIDALDPLPTIQKTVVGKRVANKKTS
jgi:hypothetical protein